MTTFIDTLLQQDSVFLSSINKILDEESFLRRFFKHTPVSRNEEGKIVFDSNWPSIKPTSYLQQWLSEKQRFQYVQLENLGNTVRILNLGMQCYPKQHPTRWPNLKCNFFFPKDMLSDTYYLTQNKYDNIKIFQFFEKELVRPILQAEDSIFWKLLTDHTTPSSFVWSDFLTLLRSKLDFNKIKSTEDLGKVGLNVLLSGELLDNFKANLNRELQEMYEPPFDYYTLAQQGYVGSLRLHDSYALNRYLRVALWTDAYRDSLPKILEGMQCLFIPTEVGEVTYTEEKLVSKLIDDEEPHGVYFNYKKTLLAYSVIDNVCYYNKVIF